MPSNKRIIFLDYLRIFAFVSVLVGHKLFSEVSDVINLYTPVHITQQYFISFAQSMFQGGGAGVIVFFMISGYIILHIINYESPIEFLIKRFFRIYPLLVFAIAFEAFLLYLSNSLPINYNNIFLQMSLFGDFFNTPYSLAGVEWTLRVEIVFYIMMALISFIGLQTRGYTLLIIFVFIAYILRKLAPFPDELFVGYFSIYFPFLFLGSAIYLFENTKINLLSLVLFVVFVFENYFFMINEFQKAWISSNFAIVGFAIFIFIWFNRSNFYNFKINNYVVVVSGLTYSIYLLHNFMWFYIGEFFRTDSKLLILLILLVFCFMVNRAIENPMNNIGRILAAKLTNNKNQVLLKR